MRRWLLMLLIVGQVKAQETKIAELLLEGCRVTDQQKVLEAINFQPGMPYDKEQLQKALMGLGLFESVSLKTNSATPQALQVTAKVRERDLPVPLTEAAACALSPIAFARQRLSLYMPSMLPLERDGDFTVGFLPLFAFPEGMPTGWETMQALMAPLEKKAWVQKALKVADEKAAREKLMTELEQHLRKFPKDDWARFTFTYLLMVQGRHEGSERQVTTLLARSPEFHPAYAARLHLALFRLLAYLQERKALRFSPPPSPLPPSDPASPGIVRWAIDDGASHFRHLPDKAWNREGLLAAAVFFSHAFAGEFLLFASEAADESAEEETDTAGLWSKLATRLSQYLVDYLRLSRQAERFANEFAVQKALADWGQILLSGNLLFGSVSHLAEALSDDDPDVQQVLSTLMTNYRTNLQMMRPYFERHRWHLERLTAKSSPYRSAALKALAECHAFLGDFAAARKTLETALQKIGNLEAQALTTVLGVHALSEGGRLTPTLVARYVAWLEGLERQQPLPSEVTLWLSYWRLWMVADGDAETMWEKVPEAERQAALDRLRRSVRHFPSYDDA